MIEQLHSRIRQALWPHGIRPGVPAPLLLRGARFIYALGRDLMSGDLSLRAMSLVYTTMIAIVPLLAFSFSVLKGLGFHKEMEPLLLNLLSPLGPKGVEITDNIIGFVDNVRGTALASVSLAILLLSVVSMAQKVEYSFNFVWRVDRPRSLARRFSEYLSVIMVGPLLMTLALGIIASINNTAVVQSLQQIEPFGSGMLLLGKLSPYLLVIVAFVFLYAFVPNTRVQARAALLAGLTAGILWAGAGSFFAQFVVAASRTEAIYSGFAIVIVAMFWLYLSWLILLVGSQLGFYIQNPEYLAIGRRTPYMSTSLTERLALMTMLLVAEDFFRGGHGWRAESIAAHANLPSHQLEPIIESLRRGKLLMETTDHRLVPARALGQIKVTQVLDAVRGGESETGIGWPDDVEKISERIDAAVDAALAKQSLEDLITAKSAPQEVSTALRRA